MPIIEVKNLTKKFGDFTAVNDISFAVEGGNIFAFLGPIYAKGGGGNYLQFLAPGVIAMGILFTAMFSGVEIIWDLQFGFLKETLVAPVSRLEIMIGRTLGGATVAIIQGKIEV